MTIVFAIRHGRTALNADGALRGRVDVRLDEVGWQRPPSSPSCSSPCRLGWSCAARCGAPVRPPYPSPA
jgi:hypothetical protein